MIVKINNVDKLKIFEFFEADPRLFISQTQNGVRMNPTSVGWSTDGTSNWFGVPISGDTISANSPLFTLIKKYFTLISQKKKKKVGITIQEFFNQLNKQKDTIKSVEYLADYYEAAMTKAENFGQTALLDKLKNSMDLVRKETILMKNQNQISKYVTEQQVIDLYNMTDNDANLKLTWIKNFARMIPTDVYEVKKLSDDLEIFDNYAILHYDPMNNGELLTEVEIEKAKDPILFGVIKGSRKLYYIADWKDEYCDLTLDEMFVKLGDEVGQINNESVKTFIDNI